MFGYLNNRAIRASDTHHPSDIIKSTRAIFETSDTRHSVNYKF